jgi:hypothetical protein
MLAVPAAPFDSLEYSFEVKWDGVRALAAVDPAVPQRFTLGCYVSTEYITTYGQPLETPISEPTTAPDEVPNDEPPAPVER